MVNWIDFLKGGPGLFEKVDRDLFEKVDRDCLKRWTGTV